ncbi:MAG: NADPH-dependent 7-cyano-7-deazaguanine reductase QueF [Legionella sp.]|jgi:7-cyano-7-deazaguanine reductase|nr:NADPH-dependent 7-cyano-7-deazaguanine reductase QueF [Legionella sp.]
MNNQNGGYGELGQATSYDAEYNPGRLFPIARGPKWQELGLDPDALPFVGFDTWNHYEVSWLNPKGKPCVATASITYDCCSPNLIESKSLKLYFNSLNQTVFASVAAVEALITEDLAACLQSQVVVKILLSQGWHVYEIQPRFDGTCVDDLDIACSVYEVEPTLLQVSHEIIEERLCSDLLRSNCPVTNQPDWGSVQISYRGPRISPESFLKYIVSFRNHQGFHEQCIERIFVDIMAQCKPDYLTVYGRYTRRGGLDINPYRTSGPWVEHALDLNFNLMRQ